MREIKFRAWSPSNNAMYKVGEMYHPFFKTGITSSGGVWVCHSDDDTRDARGAGFGGIYVDDLILMQYTGLKDKNGKEIYEGDVMGEIRSFGSVARPANVVVYKDAGFKFHSYPEKTDADFGFVSTKAYDEDFIVIGNIYENPELIK